MARDEHGIFMEMSDDEDSIATASTAESDAEGTYNVHQILAEDADLGGQGLHYLLQWEGYPLNRANWEPPENLNGDSLLKQWEAQKRLIKEGKVKPFDVEKWQDEVELMHEEKQLRRRRRKAKRRRRGVQVSESEDQDHGFDESENDAMQGVEASPKKRQYVKAPVVSRKGQAQRVKKSRRGVASSSASSEGEIDEDADSSDVEPLSLKHERSTVTPALTSAPLKKATAPARPQLATQSSARPPTAAAQVARKVAPSTSSSAKPDSTAKRSANIFASWNAPKQPRQRVRVSDKTPKDSTDPKFSTLAIQNRYQKFSRNEPAPDPNALAMLDLNTGRAEAPKAPPPVRRETGPVHDAYSRRSPPRVRKDRSPTPPSREPVSRKLVDQDQSFRDNRLLSDGDQRTTCWNWTNGDCRFTAGTCRYAHRAINEDTVRDEKKSQTCFFWRTRICKKADWECPYAHYDTGVNAPPPPGYRGDLPVPDGSGEQSPVAHMQSPVVHMTSADAERPPAFTSSLPNVNQAAPTFTRSNFNQTAAVKPTILGMKDTTCYYWMRDNTCNKSAETCKFAHRDTGVYAGPPGSFRQRSLAGDLQVPFAAPPDALATAAAPAPLLPGHGAVNTLGRAPADGMMGTTTESISAILRFLTEDDATHGHQMECNIDTNSVPAFKRLLSLTLDELYMKIDSMVTADDLKTFVLKDFTTLSQWPSGRIKPLSSGAVDLSGKIADLCRLNAAGLVSTKDNCSMVIYPANAEEWRFLDEANGLPSTTLLKLRLLPPLTAVHTSSIDKPLPCAIDKPAAVSAAEALLDLDANRLLGDNKPNLPIGHVFLIMPEKCAAELKVLVDYFHGLSCKVYHSGKAGAWSYFRKHHGRRCLVVVHPDTPLWEIPGLHDLLFSSGAGVRVFSIGVHHSLAILEQREPKYESVRLFPHGQVVFFTDDVLVYHSQKATDYINKFLEETKNKPPGGETGKIAMRPGVKDWLLELAVKAGKVRAASEFKIVMLWEAVCRLCPPEFEDPYHLPNPLPSSHLVSEPAEFFPSFEGLWEKDEEKSTDLAVQWFAGWSVINASTYRRFLVCHEPLGGGKLVADEHGRLMHQVDADPRGWSKKYQHIGVVKPDDLNKKSKARK